MADPFLENFELASTLVTVAEITWMEGAPDEIVSIQTFRDARVTAQRLAGQAEDFYLAARHADHLQMEARHDWRLGSVGQRLELDSTAARVGLEVPDGAEEWGHRVSATSRDVTIRQEASRSDARFFGYEVVVHHGGRTTVFRSGSFDAEAGGLPLGPVSQRRSSTVAVLGVDGSLWIETGDRPVEIVAPHLEIRGTATFGSTHGNLAVGGERRFLDGDHLELHGRYKLEALAPHMGGNVYAVEGEAPVTASASHVQGPPSEAPSWEWVLLVGTAAGLLALFWVAATALFTRLRRVALLRQPLRNHLVSALAARPGMTLRELAETREGSARNVEYHLRILARHGLIRSLRASGARRYYLAGHDVREEPKRVAMEDPRVATVAEKLAVQARPTMEIIGELRARYRMTQAGAWKVVNRAVTAGLVVRHRRGRWVYLDRAPAATEGSTPAELVPNDGFGAVETT